MKLDAQINYQAAPELRFGQWFNVLLAANLALGKATNDDPKNALEATMETAKEAWETYAKNDRGRRGSEMDDVFWPALVEASGYKTCQACNGCGEVGETEQYTCPECHGESVVPDLEHTLYKPKPIKPSREQYNPFEGPMGMAA